MQNVEIKTRLKERSAIERRLAALGAEHAWSRRQRDTFFGVPIGWLKLRESPGRPAELIAYRRQAGSAQPAVSDYDVIPLLQADTWKRLLGRVLPTEAVVEKQRDLWTYRHTRIHLDRVHGLGEFLELEAVVEGISADEARAEVAHLMEVLGISPAALLSQPYRELLAQAQGGARASGLSAGTQAAGMDDSALPE